MIVYLQIQWLKKLDLVSSIRNLISRKNQNLLDLEFYKGNKSLYPRFAYLFSYAIITNKGCISQAFITSTLDHIYMFR